MVDKEIGHIPNPYYYIAYPISSIVYNKLSHIWHKTRPPFPPLHIAIYNTYVCIYLYFLFQYIK